MARICVEISHLYSHNPYAASSTKPRQRDKPLGLVFQKYTDLWIRKMRKKFKKADFIEYLAEKRPRHGLCFLPLLYTVARQQKIGDYLINKTISQLC